MSEAPPDAVRLSGIDKRFGPVHANRSVSLAIARGSIHGIVGENGAGKSTLMSILYGYYQADAGEIVVNGTRRDIRSAQEAIAAGIGMVHQHFMLVDDFTVLENVVLGAEQGALLGRGLVAARRALAELARTDGLAVDPDARIDRITVGQQQRVEILKALYRGAEILILDEPTAVLTPQEAKELFEINRALQSQGKSIIFISHKLNEVLEIADRITTLRRGVLVDTVPAEGATEEGLARMMVGREVLLSVDKAPAKPAEPLLQVEGVTVIDDRGLETVRDVSLEVRAGEILGLAGVDANGQSELIDAIAGLRHVESGRIVIDGHDLTNQTAKHTLDAGLGHIPEDRHLRGLILPFSLSENLALHAYRHAPNSKRGFLSLRTMGQRARRLLKEFDVRGGTPATPAGALSGGNQQKVVLAREIDGDPKVLIAAQPTRGLDVGAIEFVHRRLVEQRDAGRAVFLISLELEEILSLSDRILVIYEGQLVGEFPPTATEEELGLAMTGGGKAEAVA